MSLQNLSRKYNCDIQTLIDECIDCITCGYGFRYVYSNSMSYMEISDARCVYRYAMNQIGEYDL